LISVFRKSAGEKKSWQAAKAKIGKNRGPRIPDGAGHYTPKTARRRPMKETRLQYYPSLRAAEMSLTDMK
jgi:hypothetical protein